MEKFYLEMPGLLKPVPHFQIIDALENHDVIQAEQLVKKHVEYGKHSAIGYRKLLNMP